MSGWELFGRVVAGVTVGTTTVSVVLFRGRGSPSIALTTAALFMRTASTTVSDRAAVSVVGMVR